MHDARLELSTPPLETPGLSRRDFIRATAAGAVAAGAVFGSHTAAAAPLAARSAGRVLGANDRISFALVGTRGTGRGHLHELVTALSGTENLEVVASCNVGVEAVPMSWTKGGATDTAPLADAFRMLETAKDLDAVIVATPAHWHARLAIAALESGRHVYIGGPMTDTLAEAFQIQDARRQSGRLVQVGCERCSEAKWLDVRDLVSSGTLGALLWAQSSYDQARGDGVADSWPDRLHPLLRAMNIEELPARVSWVGGRMPGHDTGPGAGGCTGGEHAGHGRPSRNYPRSNPTLIVEFPSGVMVFLAGAAGNDRRFDDVIRGRRASLLAGGATLMLRPEAPHTEEIEAGGSTPDAADPRVAHMRNFIRCLRTGSEPNCGIDLSVRVRAVISMADASYRTQRTVTFREALTTCM